MDSGLVLGVVEAKKLSLGPQEVLTQAERYSKGVGESPFNFSGYRVPFLYSTNGEVIWFHDIRHPMNRSRRIDGFHTPAALAEFLGADFEAGMAALQSMPNEHERLRSYQREANQAIEEAMEARQREMMVAMATGTGKTFMTVNEVYRLMKSGVAKRILFLVDRRALAAQAVRAFASFEAEPGLKFNKIYEVYHQRFQKEDFGEDEKFDPNVLPKGYLRDPQPGHAFVYVCTIQRMAINLFGRNAVFAGDEEIEDDAEQESIPIHAFDLVIADECHRGYTAAELSCWRSTLDHFDAFKVGLTATPAAHTMTYFKRIVFKYDYERAVREGCLVDYDAVAIRSDIRMKGLFLKEGEQVGVINPQTGAEQMDLLEDERQFDTAEIEHDATAPDSNRRILAKVKDYALAHEQKYDRFPKILVFAVNDRPHTSHADLLVDLARDLFGRGESFVQKITGRVDRPLQRIREFRNRPEPGIVVTVDMLSTGVDIPDLEFIVLLRPIKSRILFEQILGRGTRKGEIFPDKSHFTVFDCFGGTLLEYFKNATGITADAPRLEPRGIGQVIEDIWANRDRAYNIRCLVKRLQRIDKEMSGEARESFARFIPAGDLQRFARDLPSRLEENFADVIALLRDKEFQKLLIEYPRATRGFVVAYEAQDQVSSEFFIRDGTRNWKPEDYLQAFSRFVAENCDKIDALAILLNRPAGWSTAALEDLRDRLKGAPERFTVERLQKVHEIQYRKALVDIISMVKHAVRKEEPLFTAEERVDRAIARIAESKALTPPQQAWLQRIRDHLVENLSIEREDFDTLPVFAREGGWGIANKAFEGQLLELLLRRNAAVAA